MSDKKDVIRSFVVENFLFGNADGLSDGTSFLDEGIIDSTGILELIAFIEERYGLKIADDELVPENLDSINNIDVFLAEKMKKAS